MRAALAEAERSAAADEVPVGAVIVRDGEILCRAHNLRETTQDPTAHAELICMREAAGRKGSWRLEDCTLYITLEPCPMCAGTIINARVGRVVYGASDPKAGAMGSLYDLGAGPLNHHPQVTRGVLAAECGGILTGYFRARRQVQKEKKRLESMQ
ncbi:MAG: nucleoside deaminase [Clostridia bacterium]|nr:nucleoside deaminase [Clostridia bacterium]